MADHHQGEGVPIRSVIAHKNLASPSGVAYATKPCSPMPTQPTCATTLPDHGWRLDYHQLRLGPHGFVGHAGSPTLPPGYRDGKAAQARTGGCPQALRIANRLSKIVHRYLLFLFHTNVPEMTIRGECTFAFSSRQAQHGTGRLEFQL